MEWRPFETAPKDGTKILAYIPARINKNDIAMEEEIEVEQWHESVQCSLCNTMHKSWSWGMEEDVHYTLWMPLPLPNKEDSNA